MSGFFDPFFAVVLLIVGVLSGLDWLIGHAGRTSIKDRVANFWTAIQYTPLSDLYAGLLARAGGRIELGTSLSKPIVVMIAANWLMVALVTRLRAGPELGPMLAKLWSAPGGALIIAVVGLIVTTCGWLPILSFGRALRDGVRPGMGWWNVLRAFGKAVLITLEFGLVVFGLFAVGTTVAFSYSGFAFDVAPLVALVALQQPPVEVLMFLVLAGFFACIAVAFLALLVVGMLVPTLVGVALLLILAVLKAGRGFLEPPVSLILLRLHEGEKGVLTQVALGVGAAAKLIQELIKSFG